MDLFSQSAQGGGLRLITRNRLFDCFGLAVPALAENLVQDGQRRCLDLGSGLLELLICRGVVFPLLQEQVVLMDEIVVPLAIVVRVSVAIAFRRMLDTVFENLLAAPRSGVNIFLFLRGRLRRD